MLFTVRVLVRTLSESAAPFEDLGLQTLMTWFSGMLLTLRVILRVREFAGTVLMRRLGLFLLHPTTVFPLNPPLTLVAADLTTPACLLFAAGVRTLCEIVPDPVTLPFLTVLL